MCCIAILGYAATPGRLGRALVVQSYLLQANVYHASSSLASVLPHHGTLNCEARGPALWAFRVLGLGLDFVQRLFTIRRLLDDEARARTLMDPSWRLFGLIRKYTPRLLTAFGMLLLK